MGGEDFPGSMLELEACSLKSFLNDDHHHPGDHLLERPHMMHANSKEQAERDFKQEVEQTFSDSELKLQDFVVGGESGGGEGGNNNAEHVLVPLDPSFPCNVEEFRSKKYYLFNAQAHDLMISSLLECTNPSASEISLADPSFQPLPWQNKRGITFTCAIEDRWRDFKAKLGVKIDASRKRFLFHKRDASRYIPHTGQWLEIVKACHVDAAERHWGRNLTKHQITKKWMYGERNHGIPEAFVDAFIDSCGCCRREDITLQPPPLSLPSTHVDNTNNNKKRKLGKKLTTSFFDVQFIKQKLGEIAQQVAAAQFDRAAALKPQLHHHQGQQQHHHQQLHQEQQQLQEEQQQGSTKVEVGVGCSEFERIDEDEQSKLKEKITAIRNEMDSMLQHLPSMSRGKFLHFLEAMDGALSDLRNPDMDSSQPFTTKLPTTIQQPQPALQKLKQDFLDSPKPTKRVKWKDMS